MRHLVVNLGCKVNRVESDGFEALLAQLGSRPGEAIEADLVVVNTCVVTGEAERKTRKAVRHALRESPGATVLVTGCAAAIAPHALEALGTRVRVVPKGEMASALQDAAGCIGTLEEAAIGPKPHPGRARRGVKVQDGCDNACTYCIVHVARGPSRSRPAALVEQEVVALVEQGAREVVLTGINLGSYRDGSISLADLLVRLLSATARLGDPNEPPCRLRLSSIEPADVDPPLLEAMEEADGRICRHLHLPLQSGSSRILAAMGRPYDAESFCALVGAMRKALPTLSLTTDAIVGFPGEAQEDFELTCEVACQCAFSRIHVFPFSSRPGTPAATMPSQVDEATRQRRAAKLRELAAELRRQDLRGRAGTVELALVEAEGRGMLESYHEVACDPSAPVGALVPHGIE